MELFPIASLPGSFTFKFKLDTVFFRKVPWSPISTWDSQPAREFCPLISTCCYLLTCLGSLLYFKVFEVGFRAPQSPALLQKLPRLLSTEVWAKWLWEKPRAALCMRRRRRKPGPQQHGCGKGTGETWASIFQLCMSTCVQCQMWWTFLDSVQKDINTGTDYRAS